MQLASAADIRETVARARRAQARWRDLPFRERARPIARFHDLILDRHSQILDTIQSETGKVRRDAVAEVISVAGTARYYLANGARHLFLKRRRGAVPLLTGAELEYRPHGVVGLITPWNYPFLLGIADALPALLAGNAVVTKPSELTPLSAVLARELLIESGLAPELVAVVHGDGETGAELIQHVDYVGFTGGIATGKKVAVAAGQRLIPYSLELGGKNPMVVLAGASIENAVKGLLTGAFSNTGQTCISVERVYVEEPIFARFAEFAAAQTARLRIGWSKDWDTDIGSMISRNHAERVSTLIHQAVEQGARVLAGGRRRTDLGPAFIEPTILTDVDDSMPIAREEVFGPVVTLQRVSNGEEAIRRANDSRLGLNASVWAANKGEALEIARRLEVGSAGVNSTLLIYNSFDVPMGGIKQSGIGRRHGAEGIRRYTQAHSIVHSFAAGGGYDSILLRIRSDAIARLIIALLKWWRKVPGIR